MGLWAYYFFAKLYLFFRGFIGLDSILNLLFLIYLIIPLPRQIRVYRSLRVLRSVISGVSALLLLWHDSWLPPLFDTLDFLEQQGLPSKEFILQFLLGFFNLWEVAVLAVLLAFCILIRKRMALAPLVADQYKEFVQKLFQDFNKFFELVASSGRNIIIFFVPEHGMALVGNTLQAPGLRDIPLPQITIVPVGVKLIGKDYNSTQVHQQVISRSTSYLSLSYLLASFLKRNPFQSGHLVSEAMIADIPEIHFVAENQRARIVMKDEKYFLEGKALGEGWIKLSTDVLK